MRLNRNQLRVLLLNELRLMSADDPTSELKQFSSSNAGKKLEKAGNTIMKAGSAINDLAYEQTGSARRALNSVAEFSYKLGEAISSINDLDEGMSMTETLPTVSELKRLYKEIQKLEKIS